MRSALLVAVSAGVLSLCACATSGAAEKGRAEPAPVPVPWHSPLHRDHPWVGKVWDVRAGEFIGLDVLEERLRAAKYVLLGETHDNPDHHLLQARFVGAMAEGGRRFAVAFEMLEVSQQGSVDAALAAAPEDPDALAEAVGWEKSGWPPFAMYRPIFREAMEAGLPIVAANVPKVRLRAAMKEGLAVVDPALRARLEKGPPMTEAQLAELTEEMRAAHCGHLPGSMMPAFVLAQRMRDAQMALRMNGAGEGSGVDGAVLIAGGGHVRTDWGVPAFLRSDDPQQKTLSVVMREVGAGMEALADPSALGAMPFDYVVFTPAAERADPCEALRQHGRGAGGS